MAKYQKYIEYKDSGVEWLEQVPKDWEIIKIKHLSSVKRGASPRPIDDPKYFDDSGEYAWVRIADVSASDTYLLHTTQTMSELGSSLSVKLEPNQLFLSIAGTVGKPCINRIKACIHDGFVYFPELKIPNKFLFYVFAGEQAYKGLGKMGTQLNLNTDTVGDIKIALPKSIEGIQQVINFLDYETAQIDTLIAKQEKLIELLKEKRQAVISRAVTKGLNPNVPMKNSGVEWLGKVPEHWHTTRIKYVAELTPKKSEVLNTDNRLCTFVPMEKLKLGRLIKDEEKPISEVIGGYTYFKDGDLLLAKVTPCFENKNMVVASGLKNGIGFGSSEIYVLRTNNSISNQFLYYRLQEEQFMELGTGAMTGAGGLKRVPSEFLNNFIFALPPLEEQFTIAEYLDRYLLKSEYLMNQAKSAIQLMQERRTALISAAVTGKIDVRDWQNPNKNNNQDNMELSA
ncbi:restriction endonuclease subunit S [Acinetobacter sp. WCHA39]|uniref:restriction endonuclease subunit S n=1 Tax=Acinetobacter sp. WCHA39 TaxID=2004648 RepID=UPI000B3CFF95|nr:restriction endonuclease subunit S [Acinetobacter sp. WCHA39]